jgi:hypothetical protein
VGEGCNARSSAGQLPTFPIGAIKAGYAGSYVVSSIVAKRLAKTYPFFAIGCNVNIGNKIEWYRRHMLLPYDPMGWVVGGIAHLAIGCEVESC